MGTNHEEDTQHLKITRLEALYDQTHNFEYVKNKYVTSKSQTMKVLTL